MPELKQEDINRLVDREILHHISAAADELRCECYMVGGCVRDLLLGNLSRDIHVLVVAGSGIQVAKAVAHALSYDYAASLFELSGLLSSRVITTKDEAYNQRIGKIYEIYSNSDVMVKFMGGAYYYTKYEILIHQIWGIIKSLK